MADETLKRRLQHLQQQQQTNYTTNNNTTNHRCAFTLNLQQKQQLLQLIIQSPQKKKKKYIERNIFRFISLSNLLTIIVPRPVPRTLHPMAPEFDYLQIVTNNI